MDAARADSLDVVRAIAALGVLYGHSGSLWGGSTQAPLLNLVAMHASMGVYLFFALSGYLIAGPFIRALAGGEPLSLLWRSLRSTREAARTN